MNSVSHNLHFDRGIVVYRPAGEVTFTEAVLVVSRFLTACREMGVNKILFNATGLTAFSTPLGTQACYELAVAIARTATEIEVAFVMPERVTNSHRLSVRIATHRGATASLFDSESDAELWLQRHRVD